MVKNEFLDDIKDIQPDAIITLGNEFFMGRVLKAVSGKENFIIDFLGVFLFCNKNFSFSKIFFRTIRRTQTSEATNIP
jgi:hypothetical protein